MISFLGCIYGVPFPTNPGRKSGQKSGLWKATERILRKILWKIQYENLEIMGFPFDLIGHSLFNSPFKRVLKGGRGINNKEK